MGATIVFTQQAGTFPGTAQTKATFSFLPIDSNTETKENYPNRIPTVGSVYSYELWIQAKCTVAPDTQVFNIKLWAQGAVKPSGIDCTVNSTAISSYITPVNTLSTNGTRASFYDYTSSLLALPIAGTLININDVSNFAVFQLSIASTALPVVFSLPIAFSYDEI
jgi:hypothetical protein